MSSPYPAFLQELASLVDRMRGAYPVDESFPEHPAPAADAPVCLVFSPHPDDECIIGGWALRLAREAGYRVVNIAVTQGSNRERQLARAEELRGACRHLGFELHQFGERGLEHVTPKCRAHEHQHWAHNVEQVAEVLLKYQPRCIFVPHVADWNGTHIGTHLAVMDALAMLPADTRIFVAETEYWGAMADPNVMVANREGEVADLLTALAYHVGEISRNPYHIRVAPWMIDNVRRGAEVIGGQGGAAPDYTFATLYRLRQWRDKELHPVKMASPFVGLDVPADLLLQDADVLPRV